jgi:hypothetical protein
MFNSTPGRSIDAAGFFFHILADDRLLLGSDHHCLSRREMGATQKKDTCKQSLELGFHFESPVC